MRRFLSALFVLVTAFLNAQEVVFSLEDALRQGPENSTGLEIQRLQLVLARHQLDLDIRNWLPQLSLSYTASEQVLLNKPDSNLNQASFNLQQPLFDGGTGQLQRETARLQLLLQTEQWHQAILQYQDQIWQVYIQMLLGAEKLGTQKNSLELARKQFAILEVEGTQGRVTVLDILEAEIQIQELEQGILDTESALKEQEFNFRQLLNIPKAVTIQLTPVPLDSEPELPSFSLEELYAEALRQNPDLQTTELEVRTRRGELALEPWSWLPTIVGNVSVSFSSSSFPLHSPQWKFGLTFGFQGGGSPVELGGSQTNATGSTSRSLNTSITPLQNLGFLFQRKTIEIGLATALTKRDSQVATLRFQLEQSLEKYATSLRRIAMQARTLGLQKRRFQILQTRWNQGEVKTVELFKARNEMTTAELDFIQSRYELRILERELESTLGWFPGEFRRYIQSLKESQEESIEK